MSTLEDREWDAHNERIYDAWYEATEPDPTTGHQAQYEIDEYGTWAWYCRCDGADRTNVWGDSLTEAEARDAVQDHAMETATGRI